MKLRIKDTKLTILIIGIYQVLGGVLGIGMLIWLLQKTDQLNGPILLITLVALGLYYLSLKAGSLLLWGEYKKGLIYSIVCQAMQLIAIGTGTYKYSFNSGSNLFVGMNFTEDLEYILNYSLSSSFEIGINSTDKEYFLMLNLLAVFLLYVLNDIYKELFISEGVDSKVENVEYQI